jgi:hypothetical protein
MSPTTAVVGGLFVKRPVIVVKNEVLALKANYIRDPPKVSIVFSNYEGTRIEGEDHTSRIDETTLIIIAARVLLRGHGDVWRVLASAVFCSISAPDEDRVVVKFHSVAIAVPLRNGKQIDKSAINGIKEINAGLCPRQHGNAAWGGSDNWEFVSRNLLGPRYQGRICLSVGTGRSLNRESDYSQDQQQDLSNDGNSY